MIHIAEEGYRLRVQHEAPAFYCTGCLYTTKLLLPLCPKCGQVGTMLPVATPEKYHDETKAIKRARAVRDFSPGFDSTAPEAQHGRLMLPGQLFPILRAAVSGLVTKRQHNSALGRDQYSLFVPFRGKVADQIFLSPAEQMDSLQFICNCEAGVMPEWDIILKNQDQAPTGLIRGWRSVLGIFYRAGLIPWVPDDGRRKSAWEIRNSPIKGATQ